MLNKWKRQGLRGRVEIPRPFDGCSYKGKLIETQYKPRFKKRVYNQVTSMFPKARDESMSNPKPKKGWGTNSPTKKPIVECVARSIMVIV